MKEFTDVILDVLPEFGFNFFLFECAITSPSHTLKRGDWAFRSNADNTDVGKGFCSMVSVQTYVHFLFHARCSFVQDCVLWVCCQNVNFQIVFSYPVCLYCILEPASFIYFRLNFQIMLSLPFNSLQFMFWLIVHIRFHFRFHVSNHPLCSYMFCVFGFIRLLSKPFSQDLFLS